MNTISTKSIISTLSKTHIKKRKFLNLLESSNEFSALYSSTAMELLKARGLSLVEIDEKIKLKTFETPINLETFCFVDIETTGAKPLESTPIEIGAIKVKNGEIIDSFEEFIYADEVPEIISQITGIDASMLKNARSLKEVMQDFKIFLGDSVFVAHNVGFDYNFLSAHFDNLGFGSLLNPRLCTIDLSKRCILSKRYSLTHLNEFLGINTPVSHRAYADALTSFEIFKIATLCLPDNIKTTQDLIAFSKS